MHCPTSHPHADIGERVGHLHNTGFLKAVQEADGLEKLRHLAIEANILHDEDFPHGIEWYSFKRCSVPGMLMHLRALRTITIVGKSLWRDGNELIDEIDFDREWLWDGSDAEDSTADEDSDEEGNEQVVSQADFPRDHIQHEISQSSSSADYDVHCQDPWNCDVPTSFEKWGHKQNTSDEREQRFGYNGECGLALVPYEDIKGDGVCFDGQDGWEGLSAASARLSLMKQFQRLKRYKVEQFAGDDNPKSTNFEDYAS
ncbi:hypothetical protein PVAG01_03754 [Phlyctema vagabunda]|uniref:Uncharacterized protein n=1 Tax=Phlyctema vagabunda TaxID=108571 RepID=A0ABR4PMB0_9HELO